MKKKGFTLVELMVVLVIIVIISTIGFGGISLVQIKVKESLWQGKIDMIEKSAETYGDDNKNRLVSSCVIDGVTKNECMSVTVQHLIDTNYIKTDEEDANHNPVIINETLPEDDANYYANNMNVFIYLENDIVYAKLDYQES